MTENAIAIEIEEKPGFQDYLECLLWSSTNYADENDENGTPFDEVDAEFSAAALETLATEYADFWTGTIEPEKAAFPDGEEWPLTDAQIGHDFCLTRNRQGAGFWDRGLGDLGDRLTEACRPYGGIDIYLSDAGEIEVS